MSTRMKVGLLTTSAALLVALATSEGFTDKAVIPVKGDVNTYGFGLTTRSDGTPVRHGDTITPVQALQRTLSHLEKDKEGIGRCVTAPLTETEFSVMQDFAYQYGVPTLCSSSIVKLANAGDYAGSCQAYAKFRYVAGRDCSIRSNGCYGVWTRQQARIAKCMGAQ